MPQSAILSKSDSSLGSSQNILTIEKRSLCDVDLILKLIHYFRITGKDGPMLAATSSKSDRTLDSIKLFLVLASKGQEYPENLRSHFKTIMEQTLQLLEKPVDSASSALPESISLAVKMKSNEVLYEVFKSIDVDQEISAEVADQALSSLEATFDTNRESAHLSQEIYSAI